jgi:hypothetical protein
MVADWSDEMAIRPIRAFLFAGAFVLATFGSVPATAHCDGLDGPVVTAARQALERGDPNLVLIWVRAEDEEAARSAFRHAADVRRLGAEARELADRYFFETIVRLHRAGEGAPYTGLQPASRDLGPAIPAADRAVASGSAAEVSALLSEELAQGIGARFDELQRRRSFAPADLPAGREYIASYVAFIHYVEGAHEALQRSAQGHYPEAERQPRH